MKATSRPIIPDYNADPEAWISEIDADPDGGYDIRIGHVAAGTRFTYHALTARGARRKAHRLLERHKRRLRRYVAATALLNDGGDR